MDLSEEQFRILFNAWVLSLEGRGMVLTDDSYPLAHPLAEAGWLERRFADGEMAWFWTPQAEMALLSGALVTSTANRQN